MEPGNYRVANSEALEKRLGEINSSLSEPAPSWWGRMWSKEPVDTMPLDKIQKTLTDNAELLKKPSSGIFNQLGILKAQIESSSKNNRERQSLLDSISNIMFAKESIVAPPKAEKAQETPSSKPSSEEMLLNSIEIQLQEIGYPSFPRDPQGRIIEPEQELSVLKQFLIQGLKRYKQAEKARPLLAEPTADTYVQALKDVHTLAFKQCFLPFLQAKKYELGNDEGAIAKAHEWFIKYMTDKTFMEQWNADHGVDATTMGLNPAFIVPKEIRYYPHNTLSVNKGIAILPPLHENCRIIEIKQWEGFLFPTIISRMKELDTLSFCLNQSRPFEISVVPNQWPKLVLFALENCLLDRIPYEIASSPELSIVGFVKCGLHSIDLTPFAQIEQLFLNANPLESLPESIASLKKLTTLNCSRCNLIGLPEEIGKLTELEKLDVSRNYELFVFPETLGKLSKLKELLCDPAHLPYLPKSLVTCINLERITLWNGTAWEKSSNVLLGDFLKELPKPLKQKLG